VDRKKYSNVQSESYCDEVRVGGDETKYSAANFRNSEIRYVGTFVCAKQINTAKKTADSQTRTMNYLVFRLRPSAGSEEHNISEVGSASLLSGAGGRHLLFSVH
jgi:hypothetical protein